MPDPFAFALKMKKPRWRCFAQIFAVGWSVFLLSVGEGHVSGSPGVFYVSKYYALDYRTNMRIEIAEINPGDTERYFEESEVEYANRLSEWVPKITEAVEKARMQNHLPILEFKRNYPLLPVRSVEDAAADPDMSKVVKELFRKHKGAIVVLEIPIQNSRNICEFSLSLSRLLVKKEIEQFLQDVGPIVQQIPDEDEESLSTKDEPLQKKTKGLMRIENIKYTAPHVTLAFFPIYHYMDDKYADAHRNQLHEMASKLWSTVQRSMSTLKANPAELFELVGSPPMTPDVVESAIVEIQDDQYTTFVTIPLKTADFKKSQKMIRAHILRATSQENSDK